MDLGRLDGITVGFDFGEAVDSVELGFGSDRAKQYTNDGDFICVGKAMNVMRDGVVKSHVVYNANVIIQIMDPEDDDFSRAVHIVAHELGHVAELKWRDEGMPGVMLTYRSPDWVNAILLEAATAIWEEYAACRLTAPWGDAKQQRTGYADNYENAAENALTRANEAIRQYRHHGDIDKLLEEAGRHLAPPIKLLGYLLGHLDGIEDEIDLDDLCPKHISTIYQSLAPRFRAALRSIWETREDWQGIEVFDGLKSLALDLYGAAGMRIKKRGEGHYVDVPFSHDTLPFF